MSATRQELEALQQLQRSAAGQIYAGLLHSRLRDIDKLLRTAEGAELYRAQGRALEMAALLEQFDTAADNLKRLNAQGRKPAQ